jgi:hypothetical protein
MTGYDLFEWLGIEELFFLGDIGYWNVECATVAIDIQGQRSRLDLKPRKFSDWSEEAVQFFENLLSDDVTVISGTIWCTEGWLEFENGRWKRFQRPELPERWR